MVHHHRFPAPRHRRPSGILLCSALPGAEWSRRSWKNSSREGGRPAGEAIERKINWLTGWWFQPLWKIWSQLGLLFPIYGKIKNVPNHQPAYSLHPYLLRCIWLPWNMGPWVLEFGRAVLEQAKILQRFKSFMWQSTPISRRKSCLKRDGTMGLIFFAIKL